MTTYKCLVNRPLSSAVQNRLAEGLTFLTINRFGPGPEPIEVHFTEIEPGSWFTAGRPSQSTMVLGSVPVGTSQDVREAHMSEVARLFCQTTGDDLDQVMVVAADAAGGRGDTHTKSGRAGNARSRRRR